MNNKSTYTSTIPTDSNMKKVEIRFKFGVRRKIHRFLYVPTEDQEIDTIVKELRQLEKEWNTQAEEIDVEIVHVIRLK